MSNQLKRSYNEAFTAAPSSALPNTIGGGSGNAHHSASPYPAAASTNAAAAAYSGAASTGSVSIISSHIISPHITSPLMTGGGADGAPATGPGPAATLMPHFSSITPVCAHCRSNKDVFEDTTRGCNICCNCGRQIGGMLVSDGADWRDGGNADSAQGDDAFYGTQSVHADAAGNTVRAIGATPEQRMATNIMHVLRKMSNKLNVPGVVLQEAERLSRIVVSAPAEERGKAVKADSMAAACMKRAGENKGIGLERSSIIAASEVTEKAYNKQTSRLATILGKYDPQARSRLDADPAAVGFVERYCNQLGLLPEIAVNAKNLIRTAKQRDVCASAQPQNYAAAAVYLLTRVRGLPGITLDRVAKMCEASVETLRKIAVELYNHRMAVVPGEFAPAAVLEQMPRP